MITYPQRRIISRIVQSCVFVLTLTLNVMPCTIYASKVSASYQQCVANPETRAEYKLLEKINKTNCDTSHIIDSVVNADVPRTLNNMREYHMGQYEEISERKSLFHNLKEGINEMPSTFGLLVEYGMINLLKKTGWQPSAINGMTKYLDAEMPNVKFVSTDGHKEVVYNRKSGEIVRGINAGTANKASRSWHLDHWWDGDMQRFFRCGTPEEQHRLLAERLASNPKLVEWLAQDPSRMEMIVEDIKLASSEYRQRAKDTILGNGNNAATATTNVGVDLHSLDLDDPNGDWCKCEERGEKPGCDANMEASEKGYVIFGCTKCKKVNVKYAKMALELEQKMKDAGVKGMWHGANAEANARKAASESNK